MVVVVEAEGRTQFDRWADMGYLRTRIRLFYTLRRGMYNYITIRTIGAIAKRRHESALNYCRVVRAAGRYENLNKFEYTPRLLGPSYIWILHGPPPCTHNITHTQRSGSKWKVYTGAPSEGGKRTRIARNTGSTCRHYNNIAYNNICGTRACTT